jgi:hypothetical protein
MQPVKLQAEPAEFSASVRVPGTQFLLGCPNPTSKEWKGNEYWQRALPEMRTAYSKLCVYSSTWIPHSTGSHSVDHFVPKSVSPGQAYEWDNFRYVSSRFNSRKGTRTIVDPHAIADYVFEIDFNTLFFKPKSGISDLALLSLIENTIKYLQLNDDDELVEERLCYCRDYWNKQITLDYLKKMAPFIAYELQRQNRLI